MNPRQRLTACLANKVVDRPPVALWRHFPVDDQKPDRLAKSILLFQKTYDFDMVKITPASSFCVRDYGVQDVWKGNPEGTREYVHFPISKAEDWKNLTALDPTSGALGNQLECIRQVKNELPPEVPVIQTIFDPISQAKNLVGKEKLLTHARQHPSEFLAGLEILTDSTIKFIGECIKLGIDGVFFAIQHAQSSLLSLEEVSRFITPFDERILDSVSSLWLNIAHIHGTNLYFNEIPKKNISVLNWHDQETAPSLQEAKKVFPGAVCGGLRQWDTLVYGTPEQVLEEASAAILATEGNRFILGTGCVLPVIAPHSNITAARSAVEQLNK